MAGGPFTIPESTKSGWCMDGTHTGCPFEFVFCKAEGNTTPTYCRCDCHASDPSSPVHGQQVAVESASPAKRRRRSS